MIGACILVVVPVGTEPFTLSLLVVHGSPASKDRSTYFKCISLAKTQKESPDEMTDSLFRF